MQNSPLFKTIVFLAVFGCALLLFTGNTENSPPKSTAIAAYEAPAPAISGETTTAGAPTVDNLDALEKEIAEHLHDWQGEFSIGYTGDTGDLEDGDRITRIVNDILAENHYIKYNIAGWTMEYSGYVNDVTIYFGFNFRTTPAEEDFVAEEVDAILGDILTSGMDEHSTVKEIHDYIVANTAYDTTYSRYTAYEALSDGTAVCQGYALLAYKMLTEAGVEAQIISGTATQQGNTEDHAWNLVNIEGEWYHLDTTWNSPIPDEPGRVLYDYYNLSDEEIESSHSWERDNYPECNTSYNKDEHLGEDNGESPPPEDDNGSDTENGEDGDSDDDASDETPGDDPADEQPDPRFDLNRHAGENRFATAVEISKHMFSDGKAGAVVLAYHDNFPDALAGVPLAYDRNAPLLLTPSDSLHEATLSEIRRVLPDGKTVYILGGEAAIDPAVESELKDEGYQPERLGGENRYGTAVEIAREFAEFPSQAFLVTGQNFADAVAASAVAAEKSAPILLTPSDELSRDTGSYLDEHPGIQDIYAIGGTAALSDDVKQEAEATTRIAGANRWETAREIAETFYNDPLSATLATGDDFPDALSGGVYAARNRSPVMLTPTAELPSPAADYFRQGGSLQEVTIFGGEGAVSEAVKEELKFK